MQKYHPVIYSLVGLPALIGMWFIYLFSAQPDCFDSFQSALDSASFALDPNKSGSWFFIYTLFSIVICLLCTVMFLSPKYSKASMLLVILHVAVSLFFYAYWLVMLLAFPLLSWKQVFKDGYKQIK